MKKIGLLSCCLFSLVFKLGVNGVFQRQRACCNYPRHPPFIRGFFFVSFVLSW